MRKQAPSKSRSEVEELKNLLDQKTAEIEHKDRELEIEAALERVRVRTMAMRKSEELSEVAVLLYQELTGLGLTRYFNCGYVEVDEIVNKQHIWTSTFEGAKVELHSLPLTGDPVFNSRYKAWKRQDQIFRQKVGGIKLKKHFEFTSLSKKIQDTVIINFPDPAVFYCANFHKGYLHLIADTYLGDAEETLLVRFSKVFEQAYIRFLDLQKAEAQAREAQIEAALERIRNRTLLMKDSTELNEVVAVFFQEFQLLNLLPPEARTYFCDINTNTDIAEVWMTYANGEVMAGSHQTPLMQSNSMKKYYESWKRKDPISIREYKGKDLITYLNFVSTLPHVKKDKDYKKLFKNPPKKVIMTDANFLQGNIGIMTFESLSQEALYILVRFAKVFEFTYTRFLDLQKAEAQAREAQIEAALERVRAKAMAMHTSEELADTASILFEQLHALGEIPDRVGICIINEEHKVFEQWITNQEGKYLGHQVNVSIEESTSMAKLFKAWKEKKDHLLIDLQGQELKKWIQFVREDLKIVVDDTKIRGRRIHNGVFFSNGMFLCTTHEPVSNEVIQILIRFVKVFEQAYTRFLDLKSAEAQAREAQIEAALERVRSKTMAMHNSHDVGVTVATLFDEVLKLGLDKSIRCGIGILEGNERMETWSATLSRNGEVDLKMGMLDMTIHPMLIGLKKAWKSGKSHYSYDYIGDDVITYYNALNNEPEYPFHIDLDTLPENEYHNSFFFTEGILFAFTANPISDEAAEVLDRFARVFGQTYRRYVDLQKAEAQAREAQIEAALERIRSKAMAMQSSSDLLAVSNVLRDQMGYLGQQELESSLIHLYNNSQTLESWYTFRSTETDSTKIVTDKAIIPVNSCEYIKETIEKYQSKETEYTIVSKGKKLVDWYNVMVKVAPDTIEYDTRGKMLVPDILYYHHSKFNGGALLMISNEKPSEEAKELQRRAAKVFNLAYQRFLDFQQAEARARESLKQASLDRVRGEIASMRSKDDLKRITPIIWKELTALGVPFIRCGVFIMDEKNKIIQSHLSSPDGKSLGLLNLPYEADDVGNNAVKFWRKSEIYKDHWNKDQFVKFMKKMVKLGRLDNPEVYQGAASPPKSLDLHFVPFKQGMLYVGNVSPFDDNEIQLVQSLAEAFSIAYARFEDFTRLEAAKSKTEKTLRELRSAQTQLIHAEKMASLGELTAGIAHEIQNPLNFVNNFSEVSKELIEEMQEEMDSGNMDEVKEISRDIKQNLDKINHHGQRASGIVKGMLEHSRTGARVKELTDINVLADEYLRLSYHGLRAKDKSFNANFKTELDTSLPEIKVISQDIGRVLLNMINNAFYAVSTKALTLGESDYKPEVIVRTKSNDKTIEIVVQDNGGGIPKDTMDKIFQPFFTTKPTGSGTGLGLSISYDIITQGHDGHLEVESEEGLGTRFIIQLPIST